METIITLVPHRVTPKANTGAVTNADWGCTRTQGHGPETDVFVRDKLCLLPAALEGL